MKILAAALVLALPGAALAGAPEQTPPQAAATLPDAFAPARPAAAQVEAPAPDAGTADPETIAAAEAALKRTIAAAQAGALNYDDMSPGLAEQVRAQEATVPGLIQSFGALQSVEHRGRENGAELFMVTFANQATQWIIALDEQDKIVALLFRPATPAAGG